MEESNLSGKDEYNNNNNSLNEADYTTLYLRGLKYFYGTDCRINYKEAYEIFKKLINSKNYNDEILILLGIMYEKGYHVSHSYRKAVEFYKKAAKNGNAKAYYLLAQLAEKKILDEEDGKNSYDDVAFEYYKNSAKLNYSDAYARIGIILEQGLLNTEINLKNAAENFKKAVEIDNNPVGLNGLGNAFYNGIVTKKNYEQAVEYYRQAIHGGNIDALNNLGICYEFGNGVEQNNEEALKYYTKAKDQGHSDGMTNYAILKIKIGIRNNNYKGLSECFKILHSASLINKSKPEIFYYIGLLYEIGFDVFEDGGIIKNSYLAYVYYKRAAELGYAKGYTKLGISFFNGIKDVIPSNEKASISMLEKAIEKGDGEAAKYLNYIKSNINKWYNFWYIF